MTRIAHGPALPTPRHSRRAHAALLGLDHPGEGPPPR